MSLEQKHMAHRENFKVTFDLAGEYAKWLLSTLLLLNSGAIAGIFQKDLAPRYHEPLCFFAFGVLFALISGIFAWFNLQIAAGHYRFSASDALAGKEDRPLPASLVRTRRAGIIAAFMSAGFLALGAVFVLRALP